jgi:mRNA interferase RelE/StbE
MRVKFKPRFLKDLKALGPDPELSAAILNLIDQAKRAESVENIGGIKKLVDYETRYRVRITFDRKRDYRIGLYVRDNTIWFARALHKRDIYRKNW